MRDMRILLFGRSDQDNIASGITFSAFEMRTQIAILNILRRFSELLSLNYKIMDGRYSASEPSASMILNPALSFESFQRGSLIQKLRWGFRDKKKLDKVLQELQSWNDRLFARIQMSFLRLEQCENTKATNLSTTSILMKTQQSLTDSVEAKKLGLSNDATLLRLATTTGGSQLHAMKVTDFYGWSFPGKRPRDFARDTAYVNDQHVLLEYKAFMPDLEGNPTPSVEKRVEQLANILHDQYSDRSNTLPCRGYYIEEKNMRIVFVFDIPSCDHEESLSTLHHDLSTRKAPALEDRFVLAKTLATSLSQLFTVGWVHKSFRSENVVHFRGTEATENTEVGPLFRLLQKLGYFTSNHQ